ncbi:anti-sigma factor domain-containing protein [Dethiobacter alkaliphilus]|uniref:anti-sigma factor domain-containing protein n=1 Tax=Dethiobacter alkaliphilus TaxID=427926 RepID=UPI002226E312|nr:anti-sigma factor domain-containing protein [Dethiobacter alkaliphilus]MCW3490796.1 anti-sigma factor domain-containing protein [Dethiobacter alkaliphilus]
MTTRGIVMEVKKNKVTVLTPDGRFCTVPRHGRVQVGQEYSYTRSFRLWYAAAAVLVLLLFSALIPFTQTPEVMAYVSVDINPSLELGISPKLEVVTVEAANSAAADLLAGIKLKGLSLEDGLGVLFAAVETHAYFTSDSPGIVLAASAAGDTEPDLTELQAELEQATEKYASQSASPVEMAVVTANHQVREEAREKGLSVGKYAVLLEAEAKELNLEAADLQEKGIGRALLDADAHPGEVLREINRKKNIPPGQAERDPEEHPGRGRGPKQTPPGLEGREVDLPGRERSSDIPGQQKNETEDNDTSPGNAYGRDKRDF